MEIDLAAVTCLDEAVVALGDQVGDSAVDWNFVRLDVAAAVTDMVLELSAHRIEAVADGDVDVLVRVVLRRIALHDDLLARDLEVDADMIEVAVAPSVGGLDDHPAARDTIVEALELAHALVDLRLDGRRCIDIAKGYLKPRRHGPLFVRNRRKFGRDRRCCF
jgi:hypothetical protein